MKNLGKTIIYIFSFGPFALSAVLGGEVTFNRDIRPIFTKNCTACHGGVKEAGGISLVFHDRILQQGESGHAAVVPGKPEASELIRRVKSKDPDYVMPQPKHGPALAAKDIEKLEQWIAQGAEWEEHWSFEAPKEVAVTGLKNESWATLPLDRFVLRGIEAAGLAPSAEAPLGEWLRRASFDLIGLPPSVETLEKFLADSKIDPLQARERMTDQLLASASFGERWATVWLDLARFSDTFGYEKDPHRDIWPYRDWVVHAFNKDMPYDEFTIAQLAGDLLPDPTADQLLATAFHRNTQTNSEGGTDDEEFRVAAVIDRVSTVWTTWQATTFGCVQCHSHPYDPIKHDEFYQFMAFFNESEDTDMNDDFPKIRIANDPSERDSLARMEQENRQLRQELNAAAKDLVKGDWELLDEMECKPEHGTMLADESGMIISEGTLPFGSTHRVAGKAPVINALRLSVFPKNADPKTWPETGVMVTQLAVEKVTANGGRSRVDIAEVFADHLVGPFDPMSVLAGDGPGEKFKRFLSPASWNSGPEVGATGGVGEFPKLAGPRWFVFVPLHRIELKQGDYIELAMKQDARAGGSQGTHLRKFKIEVSANEEWQTLLGNSNRRQQWESYNSVQNKILAIAAVQVPVMRERVAAASRETRVFIRGNRLMKDQLVNAGVPEILHADFPKDHSVSRLDMARWMASKDNPLTARVMINRLWGQLFGSGIVESMEDFGTSGTLPSDLALLDHLALRFQNENGWSVKKALREIVLSSTYRQAHKVSKELLEQDPKNQLLARGPRNRLSAEMVRDQALSVSGLLSSKLYGPPVFPPQPKGVWSSVYSEVDWKESTGEDRYRRGLYTYHKRTSGFPGFLMFDAPSRDVCSARRIVSNTPLQALVTMNDPAHLEAAAALAKRMKQQSPDLRAQIAYGALASTQMRFDTPMLDDLVKLYNDLKIDYDASPEEARKLGEDAPLVIVANTLLNMDAALTK